MLLFLISACKTSPRQTACACRLQIAAIKGKTARKCGGFCLSSPTTNVSSASRVAKGRI